MSRSITSKRSTGLGARRTMSTKPQRVSSLTNENEVFKDEIKTTKKINSSDISNHKAAEESGIVGAIKLVETIQDVETGAVRLGVLFQGVNGQNQTDYLKPSLLLNPMRVLERLVDLGLVVRNKKKALALISELQDSSHLARKIFQTSSPGWLRTVENSPYFYLTSRAVYQRRGRKEEIVLDRRVRDGFSISGDLSTWNKAVGNLCAENPVLQFSVSLALAGLILRRSGIPNFGVQLNGLSKIGKTVALQVAASVIGSAESVLSWNATANGLEEVAMSRQDAVLILDEMGQGDPRQVGDSVYRILNGQTKIRHSSSTEGVLDSCRNFVGLILSSGERDLRSHLERGGGEVMMGQLVRLLSIPVSDDFPVFSCLHGYSSVSEMGAALAVGSRMHHGTLGDAYLKFLVDRNESWYSEIPNKLQEIKKRLLGEVGEVPNRGVYESAAQSFALVEFAGEFAIRKGLIDWPRGAVSHAVSSCFARWVTSDRSLTPLSNEKMLEKFFRRLRRCKDKGCFPSFDEYNPANDGLAGGYLKVLNGEPHFLIYQDYFKKNLCRDLELKRVLEALRASKCLAPGARGTPTKQFHVSNELQVDGKSKVSFFVVRAACEHK